MLKSSDRVKLDKTYIESAIFSLIKLDIVSLIKVKASLSKNFHIQPSEIDRMPMWEYEMYLNHLNDLVKEENDSQEKEMKKYKVDEHMRMADPKNLQKMSNPKLPDISRMKTPKL